ncbi:hypothetical protein ABVT39_026178 [Epinephelus coioides]
MQRKRSQSNSQFSRRNPLPPVTKAQPVKLTVQLEKSSADVEENPATTTRNPPSENALSPSRSDVSLSL